MLFYYKYTNFVVWWMLRTCTVFWDVLPCEWVCLYQCFAGTCCLHLQGRNAPLKMERTVLSKMLLLTYTAALRRKKKHNLETDACHMVISHTLTPTNITCHSISHSCCDMSFIPFITSSSNTCDIKEKPYLSPWIIYRLSKCSLSSCPHLTLQCTLHKSSSLLLNGSWV